MPCCRGQEVRECVEGPGCDGVDMRRVHFKFLEGML